GSPADDPWPGGGDQLMTRDDDNDGKPGVRATAATGPGYAYYPLDLLKLTRASKIDLAFRQVVNMKGKVDTCDRISGSVDVPSINGKPALDSHVVGCETSTGAKCTAANAQFLDQNQVKIQPAQGTFL